MFFFLVIVIWDNELSISRGLEIICRFTFGRLRRIGGFKKRNISYLVNRTVPDEKIYIYGTGLSRPDVKERISCTCNCEICRMLLDNFRKQSNGCPVSVCLPVYFNYLLRPT